MRKWRMVIIGAFVAVTAALSMGDSCSGFSFGGDNGVLFFGG